MTTITWLGSLYFLLPATAVVTLVMVLTGHWRDAVTLWLCLGLTCMVVHLAKLIFRRPRPEALDLLVPMPVDWSFPSAHTAQATAFFAFLALIACRSLPSFWAGLMVFACTLIVGGVGWSRVYLQVHYLSDVVAGGLVAIVVVIILQRFIPSLLGSVG